MDLISIEQARSDASGQLAPRVLDYISRFKQVIEASKTRTVDIADLAPITELLDAERFERIGGPGDVIDWSRYAQALVDYANGSQWAGSVRRITEAPGRVYLELEERGAKRDGSEPFKINSVTIYEFDADDKVKRLWVYLQQPHQWG